MALINNEKYSLYYQRIGLIYQRPEVKASLEVIMSVFVVSLLIFAAIRPTLTNIAALQKKIEDLDSVNRKADKKIAQIFNAQSQLNTFQDKLELFNEAVPDKFSYYEMAGRIELLAKRKNLTVQTVTLPGVKLAGPGKGIGEWSTKMLKKDTANIVKTEVLFTVAGDPKNIRAFLGEIENLDRLTLLENVVMMTEMGQSGKVSSLRAVGQISFYFYQENET